MLERYSLLQDPSILNAGLGIYLGGEHGAFVTIFFFNLIYVCSEFQIILFLNLIQLMTTHFKNSFIILEQKKQSFEA